MRNPFEVLADLYDYNYQYFRMYLQRRLLFNDVTADSLKKEIKFNIFENKDYENIGSLIKQTTLIGFAAGISIAPLKYALLTQFQKNKFRQALPTCLGVIAISTGIGAVYGTIVNATSRFRGNKNDAANHAFAALVSFPAMGVYAKTNKLQWGIMNSILVAGFLSHLKYGYSGKMGGKNPANQRNIVNEGIFLSHYKP